MGQWRYDDTTELVTPAQDSKEQKRHLWFSYIHVRYIKRKIWTLGVFAGVWLLVEQQFLLSFIASFFFCPLCALSWRQISTIISFRVSVHSNSILSDILKWVYKICLATKHTIKCRLFQSKKAIKGKKQWVIFKGLNCSFLFIVCCFSSQDLKVAIAMLFSMLCFKTAGNWF